MPQSDSVTGVDDECDLKLEMMMPIVGIVGIVVIPLFTIGLSILIAIPNEGGLFTFVFNLVRSLLAVGIGVPCQAISRI